VKYPRVHFFYHDIDKEERKAPKEIRDHETMKTRLNLSQVREILLCPVEEEESGEDGEAGGSEIEEKVENVVIIWGIYEPKVHAPVIDENHMDNQKA
jgi:hypothetical protein